MLVVLLIAEGITIVDMRGLLSAHMFIGLVLIPPVMVKLGSTGYRMVSYYAGSRAYRLKGPPLLPLRLMAPVLVASTLAVLATGMALLAAGHKSSMALTLHKLSFIVFGVLFAVHFLAYVPRVVRSLRADWRAARRRTVPGAGAGAPERCCSPRQSAAVRLSPWHCYRRSSPTAATSSGPAPRVEAAGRTLRVLPASQLGLRPSTPRRAKTVPLG